MKHQKNSKKGTVQLTASLLLLFLSASAEARPAPAWGEKGRPLSAPELDDQAQDVAEKVRIRSLKEMETGRLSSGSLMESPWSGDYWPIYAGVIAKRYADPSFPDSFDWKINHDYFTRQANASSMDQLSPAEKYDLLVGDADRTLTRRMWDEGQRYFSAYGRVESWMGICDGWSAASFMMRRPRQAVEAVATDGQTRILFYPTDIKALASLLWAKGSWEMRGAGKRCEVKSPPTDVSGRIKDISCLDTNPATWHLAVVNQVGVRRKGLIMDANFGYEVWNHPIYAYHYTFFNPATGRQSARLEDAKVSVDSYRNDPYGSFRAPRARVIVGVAMEVDYVVETGPMLALSDGPENDRHATTSFIYDLELDQKGMIIGGEWHGTEHPDFLWAPSSGAVAKSVGDFDLDQSGEREGWNGRSPIPRSWMSAAKRSSAAQQPLSRIVAGLVTLSSL